MTAISSSFFTTDLPPRKPRKSGRNGLRVYAMDPYVVINGVEHTDSNHLDAVALGYYPGVAIQRRPRLVFCEFGTSAWVLWKHFGESRAWHGPCGVFAYAWERDPSL